MSKITKRCFGQDFDSDEVCHERETCRRFVDLSKEKEIEDMEIVSMMRKAGEAECGKRIAK